MEYALDTNTMIHLMLETNSVWERSVKAQESGARLIVPPIVHYEIRRGLLIRPSRKRNMAYAIICDYCSLEDMSADAWELAAKIYAELYEKRFSVEDADILIAAFCMANGYTLVTDNIKDFENIEGLTVENWVARASQN